MGRWARRQPPTRLQQEASRAVSFAPDPGKMRIGLCGFPQVRSQDRAREVRAERGKGGGDEEERASAGGNNAQKGYKSGRGVAGTPILLLGLAGNERGEREGREVSEGQPPSCLELCFHSLTQLNRLFFFPLSTVNTPAFTSTAH